MSIVAANASSCQSLPRDFAEFLNEFPSGAVFNLYWLQGGLRFTRHDRAPNCQTFEPELNAAQQLGLIEPAGEDVRLSKNQWEAGYPRHIRAGVEFRRTARSALVALSTHDLKLVIEQLESELADATEERDDFLEAHKSLRDHPESYAKFMTELTKPIDELHAKVRKARAILRAKEAAQN